MLTKTVIDSILDELRTGYMRFATNSIEEIGYVRYQIVRFDIRQLHELRKEMMDRPPHLRPTEAELIDRVASFRHEIRVSAISNSTKDMAWHQVFMYAMRDMTQRFLINYEIEPRTIK